MKQFDEVADTASIDKTIEALKRHGFDAEVVDDAAAAKEVALKLIEEGSSVLTVTSVTVDQAGISDVIDNSGKYESVRQKLTANWGKPEKAAENKALAINAKYVIGSAHALSEDGHIFVASKSGSQIGPEVYGAEKVIYVVGAQKIVADLNEAVKRIESYVVPLEDERSLKAYGANTMFSKLLIYREEKPGRVHVIVVKEKIGF